MSFMQLMQQALSSWQSTVAAVTASICLYSVGLVLYRLLLSPIAKFPGPRIAAATSWYEFYYDVIKPGMYIYEIEKMHKQYGPIVRITPNELSIHDPEFYDSLYVGSNVRKTDKHAEFCQGTGLDGSALLTLQHDLHRRRRKVLDPFFSRRAVSRMEPLFGSLLERFESRLSSAKGKVIRLDHAFTAFSGDAIRSITCEDIDYLMDDPGWSSEWHDLFKTVVTSAPLFTSFPWIIRIVSLFPVELLAQLYPRGQAFVKFKHIARNHIEQAKKDHKLEAKDEVSATSDSIFRKIVKLPIPESELDTERLTKEAQALFGAATVAVARTMDTIAYYVLADPVMKQRLEKELAPVMNDFPTLPSFSELEKLPYLSGVVNEGLRCSYGSMHRMPRVSPDEPVQYRDWTIPPKVPVGMSAYFNHTSEDIFPDPFAFVPERWLNATPQMKKALIPFTRGSRICLGQNFALSEVTLMIAAFFRPGGPASRLKLYDTVEDDVKAVHDFMIPMPSIHSTGFKVLVL